MQSQYNNINVSKTRICFGNSYIKIEYIGVFSALLILLGTNNVLFTLLAFGLALVVSFFEYEYNVYAYYFLILPFANIFKISPEASSIFTYVILLFTAKKIIEKRNIPKNLLYLAALIAYYIIVQLCCSTLNTQMTVKMFSGLILIYFATADIKDFESIEAIFKNYLLGLILASCVGYFLRGVFPIDKFLITKQVGLSFGFGEVARFSGLDNDPNYYTVNLIICLLICVIFYFTGKWSLVKSLIPSAIMFLFIILTYSKSAMLMLVFPVFFILYSTVKRKKYATFMSLVSACILLVFYVLNNDIGFLQILLSRLKNGGGGINALTTGRFEIWLKYLEFFGENPLKFIFGAGIGAPWAYGNAAHNTYFEMLHHLGLIGTIGLLFYFRTIYISLKRTSALLLINYSVLFSILCMYFFLSELFYFDAPFHIIIALWVLSLNWSLRD